MNPTSFDTKDLAAHLKISEKATYNLIVFLREAKFAEPTGDTRKAPGKEKGKGTTLYRMLPATPPHLWQYVTGTEPPTGHYMPGTQWP